MYNIRNKRVLAVRMLYVQPVYYNYIVNIPSFYHVMDVVKLLQQNVEKIQICIHKFHLNF